MGQIEELERELESIKYQVGQIQNGLSRATHAVVEIKEEQKKLQQQQVRTNIQQAPMQQAILSVLRLWPLPYFVSLLDSTRILGQKNSEYTDL